jgi:hypothetical protein
VHIDIIIGSWKLLFDISTSNNNYTSNLIISSPPNVASSYFIYFFGGTGDWTQALRVYLSHTLVLLLFVCFSDRVWHVCLGWPWTITLFLCSPGSWTMGVHHRVWLVLFTGLGYLFSLGCLKPWCFCLQFPSMWDDMCVPLCPVLTLASSYKWILDKSLSVLNYF